MSLASEKGNINSFRRIFARRGLPSAGVVGATDLYFSRASWQFEATGAALHISSQKIWNCFYFPVFLNLASIFIFTNFKCSPSAAL